MLAPDAMALLVAIARREALRKPLPKDGTPGVGLASARITDAGHLSLTLTDGRVLDAGKVVPDITLPLMRDGLDGVGVSAAQVTAAGHLRVTLTDGQVLDAGQVVRDGLDGIGVSAAQVTDAGHLCVTLTDGRVLNAGKVVPDITLPKMRDGADGVGISAAEIREDGHLYLTLTDGREIDTGRARGLDGVTRVLRGRGGGGGGVTTVAPPFDFPGAISQTWFTLATAATVIVPDAQQPESGQVFRYTYFGGALRFRYIDTGVDDFYTGWDGATLTGLVVNRFAVI